jgi:signal transduction histidine kinase/ActR/RegA family two-component response regulator
MTINRHRRRPLFWKHTPLIAAVAAVLLLVAGLMIAFLNERSYRASKVGEITVDAQILGSSVTAALAFDDPEVAQEYVDALRANSEVQAAGAYREDGTLLAGYARAPQGIPAAVVPHSPTFHGVNLDIALPVKQGDLSVGMVYLRYATDSLVVRLARYGVLGLLVGMAILVVVVLGLAHATLARANRELEGQASDLADANRNLRVQIEEREKAEEALRQSHKMEAIGQLSGGIAHDFNNLLTIVQGNLQLMRKRIAEGRIDVGNYLDLATDGLNRASSVTQRILAFSRRQPLTPKPVELNRLIAGMSELVRHSIDANIEVDTRLNATWWTECDANQMENVILNLAINARDAMPNGGRLVIETADVSMAASGDVPAGDYIRLTVSDNGIGMSDDVRRRAIDPFFTTKPLGHGTGLGLSMVFGYITQSNGYLDISSQEGKGTRVSILMPRLDPAPAPAADATELQALPAVAALEPRTAHTPTVLIVEDEALVRMVAAETIRDEGFNVIDVGHGADALDILKAGAEIDLLITDIKLPGVNGYQLAEAGIVRRPRLKVILVTGFAQDPVPEKLAEAGAKMFYKPYDLDALASCAKRMLTDRPEPSPAS